MMNQQRIKDLLGKYEMLLRQQGSFVTIYVVGGANIAMSVNRRRTTHAIDVVFLQGREEGVKAAIALANSEGVSDDWLNDDFSDGTLYGELSWSYFDNRNQEVLNVIYRGTNLTVALASPNMMLALKTLSGRETDMEDIYLLMKLTGIFTPEGLGRNLAKFTGPRIFREQGSPWMPHHIDPEFKHIFKGIKPYLQT